MNNLPTERQYSSLQTPKGLSVEDSKNWWWIKCLLHRWAVTVTHFAAWKQQLICTRVRHVTLTSFSVAAIQGCKTIPVEGAKSGLAQMVEPLNIHASPQEAVTWGSFFEIFPEGLFQKIVCLTTVCIFLSSSPNMEGKNKILKRKIQEAIFSFLINNILCKITSSLTYFKWQTFFFSLLKPISIWSFRSDCIQITQL